MKIIFKTRHKESAPEFRDKLCEQLKGNPDFVNNNIVVSDVDDWTISLYVSSECKTDPLVVIGL